MQETTDKKIAQLAVRLRPQTVADLKRLAHEDGRSIANYLERLIEQAAKRKPRKT